MIPTFVNVDGTLIPAGDPRLDGLDRSVQAAWRWDGDSIVVDQEAATTIRRSQMITTPRQAALALLAAGHLDAVEAMLALPENRAAKITWDRAQEIRRDDPLIVAIGGAIGLTEAQIDALFEVARGL